jgi:hypothetical protein
VKRGARAARDAHEPPGRLRLTRPLPLRGDAACGVGRNGGRGAKAPTMRRFGFANVRIPFQACADPRPYGERRSGWHSAVRRFMHVRAPWVKLRADPWRRWSAARRCALRGHGPRTTMRSASTTMLRLAALHLPSPLDSQARCPFRNSCAAARWVKCVWLFEN